MTETVELPGTGQPILGGAAELLFAAEFHREFDRLMTACGDYPQFTTAEIRAELARRERLTAPHEGNAAMNRVGS